MAAIDDTDIAADLATQIRAVAATGGEVEILGGGSKRFYGEATEALPIDVSAHSGVIDYDPAELVITLRAGCGLREVEALLAEHRQMFGFEPPAFGAGATVGGTVASGFAGPRRAFAGSVRDFVLGVKMLDGRGETLNFGGRVIKSSSDRRFPMYILARLLVGSLGTLGVILEVSIRVMPLPEMELTLAFEHASVDEHVRWINTLGAEPWPISASKWLDGRSEIRLSGSEQGVRQAQTQLGGDQIDADWSALKEQKLDFFVPQAPLTRLSLPPACEDLAAGTPQLVEWGGAQRWICGEVDIDALRKRAAAQGGGVCAFRHHADDVAVFQPLPAPMLRLQRSIKSSFDPAGIFNPGRIYQGL